MGHRPQEHLPYLQQRQSPRLRHQHRVEKIAGEADGGEQPEGAVEVEMVDHETEHRGEDEDIDTVEKADKSCQNVVLWGAQLSSPHPLKRLNT